MQFSKLRGAASAAMLFAGLCGVVPGAARAEDPAAAQAATVAVPSAAPVPVTPAAPAATSVTIAPPTMSGSAWIAQGTVLAPAPVTATTTEQAVPTGVIPESAIPESMMPHAASLMELVGDMPIGSDLSPDLKCLAEAVYFEARGEPIEGQLAVAEVVINRARSGLYPADYCDVVTQPAQFSFVRHGVIPAADETSAAWQQAKAIAEIAQQNLWQTRAADALYFHATYVRPSWARRKVELAQIDSHIFYR
jgi:hypothetical protein